MALGNVGQAVTLVSGVALCVAGAVYAVKVDPTTGGAMIATGLALIGGKELAGSPKPAPASG